MVDRGDVVAVAGQVSIPDPKGGKRYTCGFVVDWSFLVMVGEAALVSRDIPRVCLSFEIGDVNVHFHLDDLVAEVIKDGRVRAELVRKILQRAAFAGVSPNQVRAVINRIVQEAEKRGGGGNGKA